jgi:hypothetical protein
MKITRRKKIAQKIRFQRLKVQRGHRVPAGTKYEGLHELLQNTGKTAESAQPPQP